MKASEAAYSGRLVRARERFQELAERARAFAAQLLEIQGLVEERDRLSLHAAGARSRRAELNREIAAFYEAWRELVAEARQATGALAGLLPAHEVHELRARMSETAVGPAAEALELVSRRLQEFAAAARPGRDAVARKTTGPPQAPSSTGRWVTAAEYAEHTGVSVQTLANWRWQDRKAGRDGPAPGKPLYRRFGRAVRYLLPEEG